MASIMTPTPMSGFVLAGGQSTRMGRDKALLDWHGSPLLNHMIGLLEQATDDVKVVGRDHLPDRLPGCGPLSGIETALTITSTGNNLIVAVDLPFLTKDFLRFFRRTSERSTRPVLACKIGSQYPLCLGIKRAVLEQVRERLARRDLSIHGFIESADPEILSEAQLREGGFESSIFKNLNTPEDYA